MNEQAKLEVLEELIDAMGGVGVLKRLEARMAAKAAPEAPLEGEAPIVPSKPEVEIEVESEGHPESEDEDEDEQKLKFKRR